MSEALTRFQQRLVADGKGVVGTATPPPDALDALDGVGITYPDGSTVSLYEFASWDAANNAAQDWNDSAEGGVYRIAATNGAVLFAGSVPTNGADDIGPQFALNDLVSAFSGKE